MSTEDLNAQIEAIRDSARETLPHLRNIAETASGIEDQSLVLFICRELNNIALAFDHIDKAVAYEVREVTAAARRVCE